MSNTFTFEWDSKELDSSLLELAGIGGLKDIIEEVLQEYAQEIKNYCKSRMLVSKDNSKSGRKGNRPKGHAKDNIPVSKIKVIKRDEFSYIVIGWEKSDTSPYYYEKFHEWGSTKHAPHPVFSVVKNLYADKLDNTFQDRLEKKLKEKLE